MKFVRMRPTPTVSGGYKSFRPHVRSDFMRTCAYCLLGELFAAGESNFELDHFFPVSKFPERKEDFYNLYYACHPCNHIKRAKWPDSRLSAKGIGFVDLCQDEFESHFRESQDGSWEGLTDSAKYTIDALKLNSIHLLQIRLLIRSLNGK